MSRMRNFITAWNTHAVVMSSLNIAGEGIATSGGTEYVVLRKGSGKVLLNNRKGRDYYIVRQHGSRYYIPEKLSESELRDLARILAYSCLSHPEEGRKEAEEIIKEMEEYGEFLSSPFPESEFRELMEEYKEEFIRDAGAWE